MNSVRIAATAAFASILSIAAPAAAQTAPRDFSTMYVFGDSLVDAGNVKLSTGGAQPNEALGYFQGRFTNGFDYTDLVSISLFGQATRPSLAGGNNFAFGGARVVTDNVGGLDLAQQLALYQQRIGAGGVADPNALYVLNFSGNDLFALASNDIGGRTATQYTGLLISGYAGAVQTLNDLGARNILITGIPNADNPAALAIDQALNLALNGLSLNSATRLDRFSYINFFTTLQTNPAALGLPPQQLGVNCINSPAAVANGCRGIFSFDGVHPTAPIHGAIAQELRAQFGIGAVPEPATWAMMIAGFGLVGVAMRRRTAVPTAA